MLYERAVTESEKNYRPGSTCAVCLSVTLSVCLLLCLFVRYSVRLAAKKNPLTLSITFKW